MNKITPKLIVGIGGSAGGLNAYKSFLGALSMRTGMAFVIVSHILPTATSQLAAILTNHTHMPVLVATNAMDLQANHVYVCPPDADLYVEDGAFRVVIPRSKRNVQVDIFFTSLAKAMGKHAIGIVFSGYDGDGAEGCKVIRANGGTNFAQDTSAEVSGMPLSAQATGCVDFVLPPEEIASRMLKLANTFGA